MAWINYKKGAFGIIHPDCSYDQALGLTNEDTIYRIDETVFDIDDRSVEHALAFLAQFPMLETIPYQTIEKNRL